MFRDLRPGIPGVSDRFKSRWRTAMVVEIENINSHSTVIEVRCDVVKAKVAGDILYCEGIIIGKSE